MDETSRWAQQMEQMLDREWENSPKTAELRAQLAQMRGERERRDKYIAKLERSCYEWEAENRLLREALHATGFANSLIELPLTAAEVERVARLEEVFKYWALHRHCRKFKELGE